VPTNKSKVLAYLPKQTYERLVLFQRDHGLSLSQAVTLVIEDYFGLRTEPLGESVSDRLTRLEEAVANLTELSTNSPSKSKGHTDSPNESINKSKTDSNSQLLDDSLVRVDSLSVQPTSSATIAFLPAREPHSQGKQQINQKASRSEWNVYLHHPRGTVEHIAGPFSDEEQAKSEMNSRMDFGLFPEFKGYQWECREDSKGYK
jgi:hypothetical protein